MLYFTDVKAGLLKKSTDIIESVKIWISRWARDKLDPTERFILHSVSSKVIKMYVVHWKSLFRTNILIDFIS